METDLGYNSKENPMGGSEMKTVFVGTNSKYIHTALGVRYIQENCRRNGLDTALVEVSVNEPVLSVLARLTEAEPDAIGFEVHIWNRSYVLELAELVRKVLPGCVVFAGGPEVLFHPARTLAACPALDYVVCGEGDVLVPAFLNELERFVKRQPGLTRTGVVQAFEVPAGFAFRRQDGSVAAPAAPVVVEDLDVLPFPYPDLDDVVRQHKIVYYESSRGCPFHCAYCLSGLSRMVRCRSVPLVLDDLDRMMAAGVPLVKFVDRTYNLDESHYLPIWEHLAAARTDTTFHFEIKGDLLDRRVVDFLKTVPPGRFQLEIGVQSTNPDVLDAIGRKDNWRKLRDNVAELLAAGNMHIHMDLIAGLPLEGMDSFARSFNEVHALHPQALQLGFLKVLPGTVMEGRKEQDGLVFMDHEPYEILSTNYIGYPELRFLKRMDEVFDLTANSGRFPFTLRYLEREGGRQSGTGEDDAFAFYRGLTLWYREKGYGGLGHTGIDTARLLLDYMEERMPGQAAVGKELLRLDVCVAMPRFKPDWLGWHTAENYGRVTTFWRNGETVQKYLPDFAFTNWRDVHKHYAVEEFDVDPWSLEKGCAFLLVDYAKKRLTRIEPDDII